MVFRPTRIGTDVHVFRDPCLRRWLVARSQRTMSRHVTQAAAVRAGTRAAKRHRIDLVIHARGGRIRAKDSYGSESPRRDTQH
jgi:hypothetical protein